jgi:hypothetical protein
MPAKGSTLQYGHRDLIFNRDSWNNKWKECLEKEGLTISYKECDSIIKQSNQNIAEVIMEENDGFKLPLGLGYFCAIRFTPKKPAIDWKATEKNNGKFVYFNNLSTFGYSVAVKWFRVGRVNNISFNEIFKFKSCKKLAQQISKKFKSGKMYSELTISDFMEKGRLENFYNKRYRKDLKEQ